jgi:AcrR family transcriptional regulator
MVADLAGVSRQTAYRYFPSAEMLYAQAALVVASGLEAQKLAAVASGDGSAAEKIDAIITGSDALVRSNEDAFSTVLRLSLRRVVTASGKSAPRRPQVRQQWLEAALWGIKEELGPGRFRKLVSALSLLCGLEPVTVLRDVCGLSPEQGLDVKRWAAQKLLESALLEARVSRASATNDG